MYELLRVGLGKVARHDRYWHAATGSDPPVPSYDARVAAMADLARAGIGGLGRAAEGEPDRLWRLVEYDEFFLGLVQEFSTLCSRRS